MDLVVRTDKIPKPGETVLGSEFFTAHGGKGANQAVAAARLGSDVTFVCRIGDDTAGASALKSFTDDGINARHVTRDAKEPTGTAMIILSREGQNSIVVAPGANSSLSDECVEAAFDDVRHTDVVLAQLETPLSGVEKVLKHAHQSGKITILNPAPARALPDSLLKSVSILTPNESEAETLTGIAVTDASSAEKAAEALHRRGVATVIITLGEKGAYVSHRVLGDSSQNYAKLIPTRKVDVVDTTAAGDVFSGALATALAEKRSLFDAVGFACEAASISVARLGAQPSIPYRREMNRD